MDESAQCNWMFLPCMHMCACQECAAIGPLIQDKCPICRVRFTAKRVVSL